MQQVTRSFNLILKPLGKIPELYTVQTLNQFFTRQTPQIFSQIYVSEVLGTFFQNTYQVGQCPVNSLGKSRNSRIILQYKN